ncbi:MAG: hypothetical protein WC620_05695 [Methanoregula sp.]|jgi:hypothetical protein
MTGKGRWILVLVCAILVASGLLYFLYGGEQGDLSKVLVINLHIGTNGVKENFVGLRYGHPPQACLSSGTLSGRLLSADGKTAQEFILWDPCMQMGDEVVDDGQGGQVIRGATSHSSEADLLLTLPYTGGEEQFELRDRASGRLMKSVSLSATVTNFSQTYPEDPSVVGNNQPQGVLSGNIVMAGVFFALFVLVVFF